MDNNTGAALLSALCCLSPILFFALGFAFGSHKIHVPFRIVKNDKEGSGYAVDEDA